MLSTTKPWLTLLVCVIFATPSYSAEMRRATDKPPKRSECKFKECTEKEKLKNQLLREGKIGKERKPSIIRDRH